MSSRGFPLAVAQVAGRAGQEEVDDTMLSIRHLSHVYPDGTRALDDVNLDIPPGMFGLLGPNGAGKSSLMRCLATLQTPTSGQIRFGDLDVLAKPEDLRATLGYLPQDFGVYPNVTAEDLLAHLAVLKGVVGRVDTRRTVETLLRQVNLWDVRKKAVASFSGGMRQRFGIAQALIGNPHLIIVDEPTAGLDPEERNRFNNLLAEIGEQVVVILSTHIVDDVADLCPRAAILVGGRIVEHGRPEDLTAALDGHVWQARIDRSDLEQAREREVVLSSRLQGGRTLLRVFKPGAGSSPGPGFELVAPTLEDVYFVTLHRQRARQEVLR